MAPALGSASVQHSMKERGLTNPEREGGPRKPGGPGIRPEEDSGAERRAQGRLRELGRTAASALKKAVVTPQILFLIVAGVFGLLMVFVTPMFHVPDEPSHFFKAFAVAEGHPLSTNKGPGIGNYLPVSVLKTMSVLDFSAGPGLKIDEKKVERAFRIPLKSGNQTFVIIIYQATSQPLPYLPQVIGIDIGRICDLSPLVIAYIGRAFNLLAWLIIVFLAISITPVLKWTFFLLGIMPMAVHLAGSLSADTVTTAMAFLFVAFVLRLALAKDKDRISGRDLVLLFVLAILLTLVKAPYYLLALTFLMIPVSKFKGRRAYYATFTLLIMLVLIIGVSCSSMQKATWTPTQSKNTEAPDQMSYIIHHPFTYGVTLLRNIDVQKESYLSSFVGAFGWFEVQLPGWFPYFYLFALLGVTVLDKDKEIMVEMRQKLTSVVTLLVVVVAIFTAMYIGWSAVGANQIKGVAGRYLIPLAPLLFLLFYNQKIMYEKGKWFYVVMVAISVVTVVLTITKIWHQFY